MTIGISKERLEDILHTMQHNSNFNRECNFVLNLLNECAEINPWLPIESAPKDRPVIIFFRGNVNFQAVSEYNYATNIFSYEYFTNSTPTHWRELPEDPKE